jgi:formylglycine-generating enzyme required for sulfatase activity
MQLIPGGPFQMGSDRPEAWTADGEGPVRTISIAPFKIDLLAVTNLRFARFVDDTGYATESERFGWSFVFQLHIPKKKREELRKTRAVEGLDWWLAMPGADWIHPRGPESEITNELEDHPVVHISWNDAQAFCKWSGKRLPTEAEWECACRGGLEQKLYPWGNAYRKKNQPRCNIFEGEFPKKYNIRDPNRGTCQADAYEPNGFGLYNCVGNVWEWCLDWFSSDYHIKRPDIVDNPVGPPVGTKRIQRGGSHLCHDSYCNRYRTSARIGNTPDSAGGNVGFRCVADIG